MVKHTSRRNPEECRTHHLSIEAGEIQLSRGYGGSCAENQGWLDLDVGRSS